MKKLLITLMVLLILCGCTAGKAKQDKELIPNEFHDQLMTYQPREKNRSNTTDNEEFEAFLDRFFKESFEQNFVVMHYSMTDYKKMGIEKPEVSFGDLTYGIDQDDYDRNVQILKDLQAFDFDSLSYEEQVDYENLEYSMLETLAQMIYYQYSFPLNSGNNMMDNIIEEVVDYTFYDKESLDDYITLIQDFDRFTDDVLTCVEDQTNDGYPMIDEWIDYTEELCERVLTETDNSEFIVSFDNRIADLDFLTAEEKESYSQRNREIVLNEILPAVSKVNETVEKYRGKADIDDYILSKLDKGYAETLYMLYMSDNESVDEIFQFTQDCMDELEAELATVLYDDELYEQFEKVYYDGYDLFDQEPKELLEYLRKNTERFFPYIGDVDYTVDYMGADTATSGAIAYYVTPPVDNLNQNIIRVNPNTSGTDDYSVFGTLSHEGFPGHLYQNIYFLKSDPKLYHQALGYTGFSEGWAVYANYYAMKCTGLDDYVAGALFFMDNYYFFQYTLIDIATNYYGWSVDEIYDYFKDDLFFQIFGLDSSYVSGIRDWVIQLPAVYTSYGAGCSKLFQLHEKAEKALGDKFDNVSFNDAIIGSGDLPYCLLEEKVDNYIADNR